MHDNGRGVPQDNAETVKWYRRAAEQGHFIAQNRLSFVYAHGEGIPQNYREAYVWSVIAAANGYKQAEKNRDYSAKKLSPAELSSARAEAARRQAEIESRKEDAAAAE